MLIPAKEHEYNPLSDSNEYLDGEKEPGPYSTKLPNIQLAIPHIICFVLSLITAFTAGILLTLYIGNTTSTYTYESGALENSTTAPHIPLSQIAGEFIHQSPFSEKPPREGNISEPIWDALIPNGLGYFIPPITNISKSKSSSVVIPSAFHQLHCLYLLRRAYYTTMPDSELQRFDFGRNRSAHVAHCFGYLAQAITCSADSTLEPAVDKENGFLGAGFARRCWDFQYLKGVAESRRVFDASGFLALGL